MEENSWPHIPLVQTSKYSVFISLAPVTLLLFTLVKLSGGAILSGL